MGSPVRVLSYNINAGIGVDGRLDLDRVAGVVRRTGADVVGLQEVDRHFRASTEYADQVDRLSERLGMEFAFGAAIDREPTGESDGNPRRYGVAVLSDHPIVDSETHLLPTEAESERRVLLEAALDVDGTRWTVSTTHFGLTASVRRAQAADVLARLAERTERLVLTGDFNATPASDTVDVLTSRFHDAFAVGDLGDTNTFPSPTVERNGDDTVAVSGPDRRIDYVFYSPDLRLGEAELVESSASDHSAVVAELEQERRS